MGFAQRGNDEIRFEHELLDALKLSYEKHFSQSEGVFRGVGVRPLVGRSPIPTLLEMGCRLGCLPLWRLKEGWGDRRKSRHLSVPRVLSSFLFYLLLLFCFMPRPLSQFTKVAFSFGEIISKMIFLAWPA